MKIIKNLNFFKFYTLLFSLPVSKSTRTIISYKCNEYLLKDDFNLNIRAVIFQIVKTINF